MNFFPFLKHIPFEVNVASGFQVNRSEVVIVWFIGLRLEAINSSSFAALQADVSPS